MMLRAMFARFRPQPLSVLLLLATLAAAATLRAQDATAVRYGRDIRPILADRCFRCHGPDAATREASLRLDLRAEAIAVRDGGAAIVPGRPDQSLLLYRVTAADPDERMPPAHAQKPQLTPQQVELVTTWIAAGAAYEEHWSFRPPTRPPVPTTGAAWARGPLDRFLFAELERHGLQPSAEADAATLVRRAFLVITGLPPLPEELDAHLADHRADAYELLVDKLFDEEPYRTRHAEHLAGPWLDAARYADTCGIHMDAGRQIWPWRDWLIAALRDDKPFNDFVLEQLAGDLLPDATLDQRVATGFLRAHVTTDEGGAIDQEYLVEYAAERTATVGSVLFGLTVGCARCHDHKFDPISQEDYYGLFAFFFNNDEPGLYRQSRDTNRALEPNMVVPSPDQIGARAELDVELETAKRALASEDPGAGAERKAFFAELERSSELDWVEAEVIATDSTGGATLTVQDDGSVLASGDNPNTDVHVVTLRTAARNLRLLSVEAMADAGLPLGKVGRAPNGNAVLDQVRLEARPAGSREEWQQIPLLWAMADIEQKDGDYRVINALLDNGRGWAVDAHGLPPGPRRALFLASAPFGDDALTEVRVTLEYDSVYAQHAFGRVRLHLGRLADSMLARLPIAKGGFFTVGPFPGDRQGLYDHAAGPEHETRLDPTRLWGKTGWQFQVSAVEGVAFTALPVGANNSYVGHEIFVPTARQLKVSLGSDDGFQLYLDGKQVAQRQVDRGVAADQDRVEFEVPAGRHLVVLKVVNTGGAGGFYWRPEPGDEVLHGDIRLWLLPPRSHDEPLTAKLTAAWRERYSPGYRKKRERVAAAEATIRELEAGTPQTMVMQERADRREAFVLMRGEYDKPDKGRPVAPRLPRMFGELPAEAPPNRLGLARWLVSDRNPLLHRVAVNRLFEFVFGTGLVRTSEDFGRQGEWPSHPELLDWLAIEFRANDTSMRRMLKQMCKSTAFRQQSRVAADAAAQDGDNRLLAWFPRRRLRAEAIRDLALYTSGLFVERRGGPSVKPYQPEGLWREVAMTQSNTRNFQRDDGEALWRRSLYTYWKRACPPPLLLTFDAPTREFCTIRRSVTNTPLQALALWNDEQFVEAARALAARTLQQPGDDRAHLAAMFRRCTGHTLAGRGAERALAYLRDMRARYRAAPEDAAALLAVGDSPRDARIPVDEHAAFTLVANAFLNLDATLWID